MPTHTNKTAGTPKKRDYSCPDCEWWGSNPKVLLDVSEDKLCPDCGSLVNEVERD